MATIQFGWTLPAGSRNKQARDGFLATLQSGFEIINNHFDSVWATDHLQYGTRPVLEGWTTLAYFMSLYPHLKFGHTVLCQSFRNPALLAKMGATLHYLSQGRFIFGLGTGWKVDEYLAFGYDFPSAGARIEQLEEALQIIKALWQEEQVTFQGKHYRVVHACCEPRPDPLPVIMIGGSRPRMLRLIARSADWWNVSWYSIDMARQANWSNSLWTGIDDYKTQVRECERACAEVGRDPATLLRTWYGPCICASTEREIQLINAKQIRTNQGFVGTPARVIEQMQQFIDAGVSYFMLNCADFPDLTTLETLVNEVLPTLQKQ